jgi:N-dimethylarginine dimethylaminohydrolase
MGDPTFFSVKGGSNPHTRTRWGTRRSVDRAVAIAQWRRLHDLLRELGVRVLVVPPDPAQPGLVYPANAGIMLDIDEEKPVAERRFVRANLLPARAGERAHYERVLKAAGIRTEGFDERFRMEGEADFFPAGDVYLFTHGVLERQRFVPALSFPPWRRVYGFRTDRRAEPLLAELVAPRRVMALELTQEAHYHGDTVLCAFGSGRRLLLVYRSGLSLASWTRLLGHFGNALIELSDADAAHYAANSFSLMRGNEALLIMPAGVSERLLAQVRDRGVTPLTVDVSEFLKKGGGSVKCMIGDLGAVREA